MAGWGLTALPTTSLFQRLSSLQDLWAVHPKCMPSWEHLESINLCHHLQDPACRLLPYIDIHVMECWNFAGTRATWLPWSTRAPQPFSLPLQLWPTCWGCKLAHPCPCATRTFLTPRLVIGRKMNNWVQADFSGVTTSGGPFLSVPELQELCVVFPLWAMTMLMFMQTWCSTPRQQYELSVQFRSWALPSNDESVPYVYAGTWLDGVLWRH